MNPLVANNTDERRFLTIRPTISSDSPSEYMLAMSMMLPPASR
nr:hypothetical protein [Fodinicola feengrottensis]